MSSWSTLALRVNAAQLRAFGKPLSYQMAGAPLAQNITAVPKLRGTEENEQLAAFESIWTTTGQFPQFPQLPAQGDMVVIGDMPYVVHLMKPDQDPDSDGITLYLNRRMPL